MKVTGSNLSPGDSPIDKTRGKTAEGASFRREKIGNQSLSTHEDILQIQRSISKDQLVLGALEQLKTRLGGTADTPGSFLSELTQSTRVGKAMVLEPYQSVLKEIIAQNDTTRLNELIDTTRRRISLTIASLSKDQITAQNILSVKPSADDLSELLRKVVEDLRKNGDPGIHLQRTRVLDLLD